MSKSDKVRLKHMLDAAQEALNLFKGKEREALEEDRVLNLALVRLVEIVGEAAGKLSPEFCKQHSQIPWPDIVGMRNRLIHGYADIDFGILYETIEDELPKLVTELKKLLKH